MKIVFCPYGMCPVEANILNERPVDGLAASLVYLAEALDKHGMDVIVMTDKLNPGPSKIKYWPWNKINDLGTIDALVSVKDWATIFLPVTFKKCFFWTGDSYENESTIGVGDLRIIKHVDAFLNKSRWQAQTISEHSGFPLKKIFILPNGIYLPHFSGSEIRNDKRLIYASSPDRGAKHFLKLFPPLKKQHPDLELHLFGGPSLRSPVWPPQNSNNEWMDPFLSLPGCFVHGYVKQRDLAREMMKSAILAYPNSIAEPCSNVILESMAAGCVVVTTDLGANKELIGDAGVVIDGEPGTPEYDEQYLEAINKLLSDNDLLKNYSQRAMQRAQNFSWDNRAKSLIEYLKNNHGLS